MKAIGKLVLGAVMFAGATIAIAPAAEAAWYGGYGYGGGYGGGYGYGPGWGGPGANFSFGVGPGWTSGRWVHGYHGPRYGWWWTVGNSWYLYPRPVYPAYDGPPVGGDDYYDYPPNDGRDYGQGYARGPDGNPQRPQYWYFCSNPEGYYPYVQDCDDWQQEPAQGGAPPGDYPEYQDDDFRREQ